MLKTICYKSKIKSTLNILELEALFNETQNKNDTENITGVLVKKENTFFQITEGQSTAVDKVYLKIKKDSRHTNIIEILNNPISQLSFNAFGTNYMVIEDINALYGLQKYITNLEQNNFENSSLFLKIIEDLLTTN
ncbi:BLUF domain-containing protein [Algibacter sp. L1A34]|uniref:BLUF domain-containing protein n=1 Tax=Algibacter sp. L1A34 TaxID=2686365 RepID=UPI00131A9582|nr:BLUF domain-containing protein [Algibacter sp. L1A34]